MRTQGSAVNSSTVRMKAMVERQEIEPGNSMLWKAEVDVNPGDSFQLTDVTLHINTMASVTWSLDGLPGEILPVKGLIDALVFSSYGRHGK